MTPVSELYDTGKRYGSIPDITCWMERKFEEFNYYLAQLLSGRGYFSKHLLNIGKMAQSNCIQYDASSDDT